MFDAGLGLGDTHRMNGLELSTNVLGMTAGLIVNGESIPGSSLIKAGLSIGCGEILVELLERS